MSDWDRESHPHVAKAHDYARAIVAGELPACKYVRLACQRQLDELQKAEDEGYPYFYDPDAGDRVCRFIEKLPHIKGVWAKRRERISLEPWQCFCLAVPFGWRRRDDGMRRFTESYLEVARKNAKSTLSAGVGLYGLVADGEEGAEVYSGATNENQAMEVFRPAKLMAERARGFADRFGVETFAKSITVLPTASFFRPLVRRPGDGPSPHIAIVDEYHEHDSDALYQAMKTGMGARAQPLLWIITTAGSTIGGPCHDKRDQVAKILEGVLDGEETFGIIYTLDDDDEWTDFAHWPKANPNMGVSVSERYLRSQLKEAMQRASQQNIIRTKHLNQWMQADVAWMDLNAWRKCADPKLALEQFQGEPVFIAVDLASKTDLAAMMLLFQRGEHYHGFGCYYLPESALKGPRADHYAGWAAEGWITVTPGNVIDFGYIEDDLKGFRSMFEIKEVPYDPFQATQFATRMLAEGFPMVEMGATVKNFSEPMKELEAKVLAGKFHFNGDPVMTWAAANVVAHYDKKDNIFPNKEKPERKIDPIVGLIMALGRAMAQGPQESAYETESILII